MTDREDIQNGNTQSYVSRRSMENVFQNRIEYLERKITSTREKRKQLKKESWGLLQNMAQNRCVIEELQDILNKLQQYKGYGGEGN